MEFERNISRNALRAAPYSAFERVESVERPRLVGVISEGLTPLDAELSARKLKARGNYEILKPKAV